MTKVNSSGQTALDIAKFWSHADVIELLEQKNVDSNSEKYTGLPNQGMRNFFAHNPLDRANHRRKDEEWLEETKRKPNTKWCLFSSLNPYIVNIPEHGLGKKRESNKLMTVGYDDISDYLQTNNPVVIFLGLEHSQSGWETDPHAEDAAVAWFAVDASNLSPEQVTKVNPHALISDPYPAGLYMIKTHAGIF